MSEPEESPAERLRLAKVASKAVVEAREAMRLEKTHDAAMAFARAFQEARDARGRLPPLRLAA